MQIVRYECDNCGAVSPEISVLASLPMLVALPVGWETVNLGGVMHLCGGCAEIARTAANDALAATWEGPTATEVIDQVAEQNRSFYEASGMKAIDRSLADFMVNARCARDGDST